MYDLDLLLALPRGGDRVTCVDLMLGVGVRPNELLAIRWEDLWLDEDIPFILVTGTIAKDDAGEWHRQDWTKGDRGVNHHEIPSSLVASREGGVLVVLI